MMEGIEVLAQEDVVVYTSFPVWQSIVFFLIVAIFAAIGTFVTIKKNEDWVFFAVITAVGLFVGTIISSMLVSMFCPTTTIHEYKVLIGDDVNVVEFDERYEIIERDGKIFTIRERY